MATFRFPWPKTYAEQVLDKSRSKINRTWSGQGYCRKCGKELQHMSVFPKPAYDAYTGKALPELGKLIYCEEASVYTGYHNVRPQAPSLKLAAAGSWWHSDPDVFFHEQLDSDHDYWIKKP